MKLLTVLTVLLLLCDKPLYAQVAPLKSEGDDPPVKSQSLKTIPKSKSTDRSQIRSNPKQGLKEGGHRNHRSLKGVIRKSKPSPAPAKAKRSSPKKLVLEKKASSPSLPFTIGIGLGAIAAEAPGPMLQLLLNFYRLQLRSSTSQHSLEQFNGLGEKVVDLDRVSSGLSLNYVWRSGVGIGLGYEVSAFELSYDNPKVDPGAGFKFRTTSQSANLELSWQSQGPRVYLMAGLRGSKLLSIGEEYDETLITTIGDWRESTQTLWERNSNHSHVFISLGFYIL